ncbi:uncharacterized protein [Rutidosis leptorrhynchoides]|uniref:uncharacterized protein n=1 Tax=Rutidosis leptorrhynchoides TaxID=125765 RepID=UPI003A9A2FE6
MAWVKWSTILAPFDRGSLNVGSLKAFNQALIHKWRCPYLFHLDDFWVKIIKSFHSNVFKRNINTSIWSSIVDTYAKTIANNLLPANVICRSLLVSLRDKIHNVLIFDREDKWVYTLNSNVIYSIKSAREYMDLELTVSSQVRFSSASLESICERIRDIMSIVCPVCNNRAESWSHLFFDCSAASDIWRKIRIWIDYGLPVFNSWEDFTGWIEGDECASSNKDMNIAVVFAILWVLWCFWKDII